MLNNINNENNNKNKSSPVKPKGEVFVVYFSSISNNTHRFVEKLNFKKERIPVEINQNLTVMKDYVLFCPTYSGGNGLTSGAVPKQVIKFLNNEQNRKFCKGVIASGNTNFGDTFALAGSVISKKLNVPFLYSFELLGTNDDVVKVREILKDFWGT
ncbi:class Ib ribonucleoside-diphosphate reductase assembly flavoprotein NrdI [Mycoplasma flocculare]|uniref:Protein NrdI n=2 Tax=Mesomycoplasma flocculare TaxID=2128 RepID=A0A0A8ECJ7_MESFC|nr:class Ib ribonucleoside-diphosphate reductase assembly flavoprotein NrdI [Mesomycoplasma flocculare]MXR39619.1 class Ib ribonucleoside-diphosphate reductase assembly flavoprotein NrdI [Mycoplasma sp. MF12]AJC49926.1 ribonucleotide reductase stimulatory protein [Mesomycoplasma flocculare ATCC 27399]ENX50896.1 ribonucleotide reductase stimulatory protein [Mesomycoplasma flocculare ATCC 27716]MXR06023.1 class Ib ribonucleoside-diphosphate reductase assembly flavoprotein NrdI [Mesomycoplasma flo